MADTKKKASVAGTMTTLMMPQNVSRAEEAYRKAMDSIQKGEQAIKQAASPMEAFQGALAGGFGGIAPGMISNLIGSLIQRRTQPTGGKLLAQEFIKGTGKELSSMAGDAVRSMAGGLGSAIGGIGDSSARDAIIEQLRKEDPVIARADKRLLQEAYDTMVKFAPTLSMDKNAVRSYLREAVLTGSGPNYATIKMLADAERAVSGGKDK